jgi:hypothetical protein
MKKLLVLLFALSLVFVLGACSTEEGDYEPGVYFGYTEGGENTFAVVTVDENGFISEILIDSVYLKQDAEGNLTWEGRGGTEATGYATTKRSLDGGCGYHMHTAKEVVNCSVEGELMWHEQVDLIADAVIEAQEVPNFTIIDGDFDPDAADSIAGVTITVTSYIEAIEDALDQAKK